MATKKFSKSEALRFGWTTMKNNLGFFIGLIIVAGLIIIIPYFISGLTSKDAPVISLIITIVCIVLQLIIGMGLIRISLKFADNDKAELGDLFACLPMFFKYLGGSILYGLIIIGGLILLIVPGIIWAIKFCFFGYFIIDKELGPIEALKRSSIITKGAKWDLFLFGLLTIGINILGVLALLIGLFATLPTTMVAYAFVYRKLLAQTEIAQTPVST